MYADRNIKTNTKIAYLIQVKINLREQKKKKKENEEGKERKEGKKRRERKNKWIRNLVNLSISAVSEHQCCNCHSYAKFGHTLLF